MSMSQTVLLLGGTGRTGRRALRQLLDRDIPVRVIVRSVGKLPPEVVSHPSLTVIEAGLPSLPDEALRRSLDGCTAVVSCLGHEISLKGLFGPPRDLVTRTTSRLCRAIEALQPATPVKFLLMSSVAVHRLGVLDARRGGFERGFLRMVRAALPPAEDNQRAADFLIEKIGSDHTFVQWVVVRPDSLLEGDVSEYAVHEGLVNGLFAPGSTNRANVAHFMCELATNPKVWEGWKFKLPVIVNAASAPQNGGSA